MTSLRRVRQRLRLTTTVLLHGPGALPGRRSRAAAAPGPNARRRLVEQQRESAPRWPQPHPLLADADVSPPRVARDRFPHALSTDLGPWQELAEVAADPDRQLALPPQVDLWDVDDPALGFATGCYRARLVEPGITADQVRAAALSGTPMFGLPAAVDALPADTQDLVTVVQDVAELRAGLLPLLVQDELFDRVSLQLRRRAVRRWLGTAGEEHLVSAVVPTNRPHRIAEVLANIGRQRHPVELVLVLHGLDLDADTLREQARAAGVERLTIVHADAASTLGTCMNLGVDAASGAYVAKMDDDNHYGAEFLGDLVDAIVCTGAEIAGKWAHHVWLRSTGAVVLRYPESESCAERRVQGGAMLFRGDVVRALRFSDIPRAVDSDILDRALAHGYRVYSADRYNYVSVRESDTSAHTWQVGDESFLTRKGVLLFYGDPVEHVTV